MTEYKIHTLCAAVPSMTDDEYNDLKNSMQQNGYLTTDPIAVKDGFIIDGRHRYSAAVDTGVEPLFVELDMPWDHIPAFVASRSTRRNLTTGQRAAAAAKMVDWSLGAPPKNKEKNFSLYHGLCTLAIAVKAWNVSDMSIKTFHRLELLDTALADAVAAGKITLNAALKEALNASKPKPEDNFDPEDAIDEAKAKAKAKAKVDVDEDEPEDFGNPFGNKAKPEPEPEVKPTPKPAPEPKAKPKAEDESIEALKERIYQLEHENFMLRDRFSERNFNNDEHLRSDHWHDEVEKANLEQLLYFLGYDAHLGYMHPVLAATIKRGLVATFHPDKGHDARITQVLTKVLAQLTLPTNYHWSQHWKDVPVKTK
jgi:hypothetical protein